MVDLKVKILDWARDKNDFFCIHDILDFFNTENPTSVTGTVGLLTGRGLLVKTDVTRNCKASTKKHSFYIFNKPKIEPIKEEATAKITEEFKNASKIKIRTKRGKLQKELIQFTKNRKKDFCLHEISNKSGIEYKQLLKAASILQSKGVLVQKEKRSCKTGERTHHFWSVNPKFDFSNPIVYRGQKVRYKKQNTQPELFQEISEIDQTKIPEGYCILAKIKGTKFAIMNDKTLKFIPVFQKRGKHA